MKAKVTYKPTGGKPRTKTKTVRLVRIGRSARITPRGLTTASSSSSRAQSEGPRLLNVLDELCERPGALRRVARAQQLLGPSLALAAVGREFTRQQTVVEGAPAEETGEPAHGETLARADE